MTNIEKLHDWIEREKTRGLVNFRITPNLSDAQGMTAEEFAGDVLGFIKAIKKGNCTEVETFEK